MLLLLSLPHVYHATFDIIMSRHVLAASSAEAASNMHPDERKHPDKDSGSKQWPAQPNYIPNNGTHSEKGENNARLCAVLCYSFFRFFKSLPPSVLPLCIQIKIVIMTFLASSLTRRYFLHNIMHDAHTFNAACRTARAFSLTASR